MICVCIGWLLPGAPVWGQTPDQASSVHVQHEGFPSVDLGIPDLAGMRKIEIRAKDHEEKEHSYTGVALSDVLKKVGVPFGTQLRGGNMTQYLLVGSSDGYQVIFALAELDSTFTDRTILLAYTSDGQRFPANKGPFQIIVPGERKHARWILGVKNLVVKSGKQ